MTTREQVEQLEQRVLNATTIEAARAFHTKLDAARRRLDEVMPSVECQTSAPDLIHDKAHDSTARRILAALRAARASDGGR